MMEPDDGTYLPLRSWVLAPQLSGYKIKSVGSGMLLDNNGNGAGGPGISALMEPDDGTYLPLRSWTLIPRWDTIKLKSNLTGSWVFPRAVMSDFPPLVLETHNAVNDGSTPLDFTISFSETITESYQFTFSTTSNVGIEISGDLSLPFIGDVGTKFSSSLSVGTSSININSDAKTAGLSYHVTVPAGQTYQVSSVIRWSNGSKSEPFSALAYVEGVADIISTDGIVHSAYNLPGYVVKSLLMQSGFTGEIGDHDAGGVNVTMHGFLNGLYGCGSEFISGPVTTSGK